MLTFNEVRSIFLSYPELIEKVSGKRYSYHVKQSIHRGKEVAREIVCNRDGTFNGYINAKYMPPNIKEKYKEYLDQRQMIKIKDFNHNQLHQVIHDTIQSMTNKKTLKRDNNYTNKINCSTTSIVNNLPSDPSFEKLVRSCLYNWLGYGNPNSKIWFIGTEEGGAEVWRQQTKTLEESLLIRANFKLHMDFQDVWENQYNISLTNFKGGSVWNFIAAFLLNLEENTVDSDTIRDFVYNQKKLGRANSNHYLCELFPLPKTEKNSISPYENIWSSINAYHAEIKDKRLELIKKTIIENYLVKLIVAYERGLVELLQQNLADSMKLIQSWEYGKQKYFLYQIKLNFDRTIYILSTPFFGQGQISYEGIKHSVNQIKNLL